ncbi:hypothetical protein BD309DRAFT_987657 [Dichomitus squalens]|uniref:Uncharacterized protein n=1 Tax=Dichomitus squalens TaxID=114155 RepID=A0A4Q9QFQ1_9APHY|nr:hypothetical protein BD309DRAFT_987657 [Dichomitus squalens]TBU66061.1 hypothetical protein BD310DRAFT_39907 [Dichomitus squalens]
MSLFYFCIKFFVWNALLVVHVANGAVFLFFWINHRSQVGMMSIWIVEAAISLMLLARMAVYIYYRNRMGGAHIRKLHDEWDGWSLMWAAMWDMIKLAFIAFQIAPSDVDRPGSLPTDFAALGVSNPILASALLLIPSVLTNAIEWPLFSQVDKSNWNGTYDGHWLNRPLVRPPPRPFRPFAFPAPNENFSARIVAVQHGSPPEMWAHKPGERDRRRVAMPQPLVQPAKPTYDHRAPRRLRTPPPIKTTWNQWYITPGEAY